jgi:hypothetical protein
MPNMHENSLKNLRPPWKPGETGNVNGLGGRPLGSRTAFSEGYIRDFALVWQEEGIEAIRKVAKKNPDAFVAIAQRLVPYDVRLSIDQAQPSALDAQDVAVLKGIKASIPNADKMSAEQVLGFVRDAVNAYQSPTILALPSPGKKDPPPTV